MPPPRLWRGFGSLRTESAAARVVLVVGSWFLLVVSALPRALILLGFCLSALPSVLIVWRVLATSPAGCSDWRASRPRGPLPAALRSSRGPNSPSSPPRPTGAAERSRPQAAALLFGSARRSETALASAVGIRDRRFQSPAPRGCHPRRWEPFKLASPHGGQTTI